jgi:hypothetical protein
MSAVAAADLSTYLGEARRVVEEALDTSLEPLRTPPAALHEAMHYTLLLPGKRLRGIVVLRTPPTSARVTIWGELRRFASAAHTDRAPSLLSPRRRRGFDRNSRVMTRRPLCGRLS